MDRHMSAEDLKYKKMTETPVPRLIVTLGVPTIVSMLITNIYNTADTYFVSRLGNSASGAVGVVFGLMAILQAFGFMFGHGAGSIISRKLGQRDKESASRFASTGFFLAAVAGLLIGVLGLLFLRQLMYLLGSTHTIYPYARQYAVFILLAAPFMTSSCVMNNILRYEGMAVYAMIGLTAGGVLNIILDPVFMFGMGLGIRGAGLATGVSQIVSFLLLLYMFLSGKTESRLSFGKVTRNRQEVVEIVKTGVPSLIRQGFNSMSTMLLNHQAAIYGDTAVAAMSIVNRISSLMFSVGLGTGQGYQPVAAFNYGAGRYSRVKKGFWFTTLMGEGLLGGAAVICLIFSGSIVALFRNDPQVIAIGTFALRCQCAACFFQPFSICNTMMLQSVGKSVQASVISALRSGIYFIPLILILPSAIGLMGVQISQTLADILTFLTCIPFTVLFFYRLPMDKEAAKEREVT